LYPCSVATQAGDGTLDLIPDDERIKGTGLSGIKIRYGQPGWTATVPANTRVLLGFEAGDPKRPYAALWDAGAVTTLTFDSGTEDMARTNDSVGELYIDSVQWAANVLAGTIVAPHLYYYQAGAWVPVATGIIPPVAPGVGTTLLIDSGNTKLKA
jgi:hypothetical protein